MPRPQRPKYGAIVPMKDHVRKYFETGIEDYQLAGDDTLEFMVTLTGLHESQQAEEWRKYDAVLVREWISDHPGTRPWAWWAFDAPGPRAQISGTGRVNGPTLYKGIPQSWYEWDKDDPPTYESEAHFLDRYGLLKAEERRRIKPASWDRESIETIIPTQLVIGRERE